MPGIQVSKAQNTPPAVPTAAPATFFKRALWAFDYVPILSTGKGAVDLFAKRFWKPEQPDQLSYYFKTYYHHLSEKDNVRYIALIPIIGNGTILVLDGSKFVGEQLEQLESIAILNKKAAVEKAMNAVLNGKDSTAYFDLSREFERADSKEQERILIAMKTAAESGNKQAFEFIEHRIRSNPSSKNDLCQWILEQAEDLSSPVTHLAWKRVKLEYSFKEKHILSSYLKMLGAANLPKERASHIKGHLYTLELIGSLEQKTQIVETYVKMAEGGHVKMMHRAGKLYHSRGNQQAAVMWYEKAARADHVSSILKLAKKAIDRGDVEKAQLWLFKAKGRCNSLSKQLQYRSVELSIDLHKMRHSRSPFDDFFADAGFFFGTRNRTYGTSKPQWSGGGFQYGQRTEQPRAYSNQETLASLKTKLVQTIGEFSNLQEIEQKFRRWSLKNHPDKGGNEEEFKRVVNLVDEYKKLARW